MRERSRKPIVAVIGDGLLADDDPKVGIAREVGRGIVSSGWRLLAGGRAGVMRAASQGARESHAWIDGDILGIIPGTDPVMANEFVDIVLPTGIGPMRNTLIAQADAIIAIGGGAGTLSELAMAWKFDRLIVALRIDGWAAALADTRVDSRQRYPELTDDQVFGADSAAEAIEIVEQRLIVYQRRSAGVSSSEIL